MTFSRFFSGMALFVVVCACALAGRAQSVDRTQIDREIKELYEQIKIKEILLLAPSPEDQAAFTEYLNSSDKGLIRLLPREKYDGKLSIRGGGAYYSFVLKTHEYGHGSDIELSQGNFSVGFAGMDYGYFIPLGDIPLETITLEHPAVKALADYQPRPTEAEIRAENRNSYQGYKLGEFMALRRVPVKVGASYVLRSLSFDDSDVLVSVRVVRQDNDGSVILLWKILKNFPKPKAIRTAQN